MLVECCIGGNHFGRNIIENRLQDRPAKNEAAQSGRRDIMSVEDEKTPCVPAQITNVPRPCPTSVIFSWMQNPRTCYCGGRIRPWSPFAPRPCASTSSSLVASSLVATRTCTWSQGLQKDTSTCTGLCVTGQGEVRRWVDGVGLDFYSLTPACTRVLLQSLGMLLRRH